MNIKLRVLSAGAIFFMGASMLAQKKKSDTVTNTIEEVVILGTYGIKESQEQKVGAYSKVGAKELERPAALSLDLAIAGQVPGAVINANSGQPGSNAKIFIRGISSLFGESQPLYIIDGIPIIAGDQAGVATTSNALAMIDPSDIESVEVLKDGATTSIYGSRGAAGVIVIRTKSGRGGRGKLTMNAEYGFGSPAYEKFKFLDATQAYNVAKQSYMDVKGDSPDVAAKNARDLFNWDGKTNSDWQKATRRSVAASSRYNMNYSFGNDKIKGFASVGHTDQEGITRDALYKRMNATVKIDAKLSDKLDLSFSNILARSTQYGPLDYGNYANPILSSRFISPTQPIYNADGSYNLNMKSSLSGHFNPVGIQDINQRISKFTKIVSSAGLDYKLFPNFRLSSKLGVDYNYYDESEYRNPDFGDGLTPSSPLGNGLAIQSDFSYSTVNWTNFGHFEKSFGENNVSVSLGTDLTVYNAKRSYQASKGFRSGHWDETNVSSGVNPAIASSYSLDYHLIGYIARASYGYKDLFNVMGSFRRDGYSHFGAGTKYGNFWAVGSNFNFQNFGNVANTFQNLQLRLSYGEVGNVGGENFMYKDKASLGYNAYAGVNGLIINEPGNKYLSWESSKKYNAGIDFGIIKNKLRGSVDVYYNLITDQLTNSIENAPSTGVSNLIGNALESNSKGVEASLSYDILRKTDLTWTVNANYAYNKSKILKLTGSAVSVDYFKRFVEGHNPSEWYLRHYAGVDHSNGDALWYTNGSHTVLSNGSQNSATINADFTGKNAMPAHTAGFNNSFSYKNISVNFLLTYQGDYSVYDLWGRYYDADGQDPLINQVADVANAWTPNNKDATRPQYRLNNTVTKYHSTRYLYKGDHIKLKSAEVGYKLMKDVHKIPNVNNIYLYLRGTNLLTFAFDKNLPFDPEANSNNVGNAVGGMGVYDQTQPFLRTFLFGATIDF